MKAVLFCSLLMVFLCVAGCEPSTSQSVPRPQRDSLDPNIQENVYAYKPTKTLRMTDYGNGVYYFPSVEADFGNALSMFLQNHTNLEVGAIGGDVRRRVGSRNTPLTEPDAGACEYGATVGYFVTFREKK
jgi:hypothetical protein